jgi:hypothetical protein
VAQLFTLDGNATPPSNTMPTTTNSSELLADSFVSYLFERYRGTRHVRRVASWLGFIIKAVEGLPGVSFSRRHSRQLGFDYGGRTFKARYNHKAGARGGIEIVEVLPGRGAPEGGVAASIVSLSDAEDVYTSLRSRLDSFIQSTPTP